MTAKTALASRDSDRTTDTSSVRTLRVDGPSNRSGGSGSPASPGVAVTDGWCLDTPSLYGENPGEGPQGAIRSGSSGEGGRVHSQIRSSQSSRLPLRMKLTTPESISRRTTAFSEIFVGRGSNRCRSWRIRPSPKILRAARSTAPSSWIEPVGHGCDVVRHAGYVSDDDICLDPVERLEQAAGS